MSFLRLWFSSKESPELEKALFWHPQLKDPIQTVRGKDSGALSGSGTFQWTPAVEALCVLLLRNAANFHKNGENGRAWLIEGGRASPAASLDYAISKQPLWLAEMFGWDSQGQLIARRLFKRTNPEQKRPGPVTIGLNTNMLPLSSIEVLVCGAKLSDPSELASMAAYILSVWTAKRARTSRIKTPVSSNGKLEAPAQDTVLDYEAFLKSSILEEAELMLASTDIFNRQNLKNGLNQLYRSSYYQRLTRKADGLISEIDARLQSSSRLGIEDEKRLQHELKGSKPLRISVPGPASAAAVIFEYLRSVKSYNLEIEFRYPHAVEIARRIVQGRFENEPDACILGIAPAAWLIGKESKYHYHSLMMFPKNTQRIVCPKQAGKEPKLDCGEYAFILDDPSNPAFYFEELEKSGDVSKNHVAICHMEPDEVFSFLSNGRPDSRAILFFPHYFVNERYNNCQVLAKNDPRQDKEMFLFVHSSLLRNRNKAECLDIAIRDAWLELKSDRTLREQMVSRLVGNPEYSRFMKRVSGLHSL